MLNRTTQALMLAVCVFAMVFTTKAQTESYMMYETILITPDYTQLKTFGENMRAHNQKYHNEVPYQSYVNNIVTGPNTGKIVWVMGPLMFSHLDGRPSEGGHDDDWNENIMPYVKKMQQAEYWKMNAELSHPGESDPNSPSKYLYIRYWKVERNEGHNINRLFKQVSDTFKAMEGNNPWFMYSNEFRQGNLGRHIATVTPFDKWAELDEDPVFKATFIKVHGESEWDVFLENMNDSFEDSWDEIWSYNAQLSGQ